MDGRTPYKALVRWDMQDGITAGLDCRAELRVGHDGSWQVKYVAPPHYMLLLTEHSTGANCNDTRRAAPGWTADDTGSLFVSARPTRPGCLSEPPLPLSALSVNFPFFFYL